MSERRVQSGGSSRARWSALSVAVALVGSLFLVSGPAEAAFPGINGKLACQSNRAGNNDIWTFDPSGTEVGATNLTAASTVADTRPKWSPDGREIAFDRGGQIWIMNADGSNQHQVTITGPNNIGGWSPDGTALVFQTTRHAGFSFEVYKINTDGTNEVRLTTNVAEDSLPTWSPDGKTIAFSSRRADPLADVHLMDPDGNVFANVTNSPGEDSWPNWSPDGSQITFHSRLEDPNGEEIYRIMPNGTGRTRLTFNVGAFPPGFDVFPAWSPDGSRFVWTSGREGNNLNNFQASAVDGSGVVQVTSHAGDDQRCDWQPLCTIYGAGNILGTAGNDVICGSAGADSIAGLGGNDTILGLGGNDRIIGGPGNDNSFGGYGDDRVTGGDGNDVVSGGPGTDQLTGDAGTDHADGGYGTDTCYLIETQRECP